MTPLEIILIILNIVGWGIIARLIYALYKYGDKK